MSEPLNRRELLSVAAMAATAACLACLGDTSSLLADDAAPATQPTTQPAPKLVDIGLKSDYSKDGITSTFIPTHKLAVVRHDGKLFALTAVCPHKKALLEADTPTTFFCDRHHSAFDIDGNVTHGPAKKALVHFAISVDANGHVIVDMAQKFGPDSWNNPACFIAIS
jgi:nitrite reductase/ring-hydroxylating ferredoxin subunit